MTMEVTTSFQTARCFGEICAGKELSYEWYSRVCDTCSALEQLLELSLPSQDYDVVVDRPILAFDFITTFDRTLTGSPPDSPPSSLSNKRSAAYSAPHRELLQSAKRAARHSAGQATDSVSRSREEITVETPSPRMLIPYSASAISIVRF
jgi:hypothetical protein